MSAWESSRSCHRTSVNQPLFTSLEIPWGFLTRSLLYYLVGAYVMQENTSFRFMCKKRYDTWLPNRRLHQKPSAKGEKGEKTSSESYTRFPWASCFEKLRHSVPETWGRMYNAQPWNAKGMRKRDKTSDSRAARKGTKKLVSSNFVKILDYKSSD